MTTGHGAEALVGLHPLQDLGAVHFRKLQVEENEPRKVREPAGCEGARAEQVVQRLGAVAQDHDIPRNVALRQGVQRQLGVVCVVFDENDLGWAGRHRACPPAVQVYH